MPPSPPPPSSLRSHRFFYAGDSGVIVSFEAMGESVTDHESVTATARRLGQMLREGERRLRAEGVVDTIPGINSLTIQYDCLKTSSSAITALVEKTLPKLALHHHQKPPQIRKWVMPILYDLGLDLADIADKTNLTTDAVIAHHSGSRFTVAMMGFMPGFPYLKGMDRALYLPRRHKPRTLVPPLSVGIAMDQTVIYPQASPGGWNLIGRVPVRIFDPRQPDPILLRPDDVVVFRPIDAEEFAELEARAAAGEAIIQPQKGAR